MWQSWTLNSSLSSDFKPLVLTSSGCSAIGRGRITPHVWNKSRKLVPRSPSQTGSNIRPSSGPLSQLWFFILLLPFLERLTVGSSSWRGLCTRHCPTGRGLVGLEAHLLPSWTNRSGNAYFLKYQSTLHSWIYFWLSLRTTALGLPCQPF